MVKFTDDELNAAREGICPVCRTDYYFDQVDTEEYDDEVVTIWSCSECKEVWELHFKLSYGVYYDT